MSSGLQLAKRDFPTLALLLRIQVLHDLMYQNSCSYGSSSSVYMYIYRRKVMQDQACSGRGFGLKLRKSLNCGGGVTTGFFRLLWITAPFLLRSLDTYETSSVESVPWPQKESAGYRDSLSEGNDHIRNGFCNNSNALSQQLPKPMR